MMMRKYIVDPKGVDLETTKDVAFQIFVIFESLKSSLKRLNF